MKKSHRTSRAVFLFCFCCDARSMQATFADLTNANVWFSLLTCRSSMLFRMSLVAVLSSQMLRSVLTMG